MFFVSNPHSVLQMQMRLHIKHHPSGLRLTFLKHHHIQFHPQATEPFFLYGGHGATEGVGAGYWRSQDVQVFGCC